MSVQCVLVRAGTHWRDSAAVLLRAGTQPSDHGLTSNLGHLERRIFLTPASCSSCEGLHHDLREQGMIWTSQEERARQNATSLIQRDGHVGDRKDAECPGKLQAGNGAHVHATALCRRGRRCF
jgi:hypothetical protein